MMRLLGALPVSLLLCLVAQLASAGRELVLECLDGRVDRHIDACAQPLEAVTAVTVGTLYIAKLPCRDCPVTVATEDHKHHTELTPNDLFFNITLSHESTSILLNGKTIFPSFPVRAYGEPVSILAEQVPPEFNRTALDQALYCAQEGCLGCRCIRPTVANKCSQLLSLDYDLAITTLQGDADKGTAQWEITFDAIGGHSGYLADPAWTFKHPDQPMLRIIVEGYALQQEATVPDVQAASTLFGPFGEEEETLYELKISEVELVHRGYKFLAPENPSIWSRLKHFFGFDPETPNHLIYFREQWDRYGKKDTLKNSIGQILHWSSWPLVAAIVGSTAGGLLLLYGVYRAWLWFKEQGRLARWGGIDEVWRQIGDVADDEERLLDDGYRDDPDDALPPPYTDDFAVNKPLPSKPLPEKPLPAVPLIEDV